MIGMMAMTNGRGGDGERSWRWGVALGDVESQGTIQLRIRNLFTRNSKKIRRFHIH